MMKHTLIIGLILIEVVGGATLGVIKAFGSTTPIAISYVQR